jgi:hypothetical protein
MPTRNLPNSPRLEHLKNQAKSLLKQVRAEDPEAVALAAEFHPVSTLADAQVAIARSYGFASWPRLARREGGPLALGAPCLLDLFAPRSPSGCRTGDREVAARQRR